MFFRNIDMRCSSQKVFIVNLYPLLMRVKLKSGKQKEIIKLARKNYSWEELAKSMKLSKNYLRLDVYNEKVLLSEKNYNELCRAIDKKFDSLIIERLPDNWGRSKGGNNSPGSKKKIIIPKKDEKLAEFIGAVLGDGNINYYKKGKKIGVYQIKIAGDYVKDRDYHLKYLKKIGQELFGLNLNEIKNQKYGERFLVLYSKEAVEFFISLGILPGDKIKNQSSIPQWIFEDNCYIKACIKGLIDTDGSIFRMSQKDHNLIRISFVNHNQKLLSDTKKAFIKLGFNPSKIVRNRTFYISRQEEIKRYIREIGFKNPKHLSRLLEFKIAS